MSQDIETESDTEKNSNPTEDEIRQIAREETTVESKDGDRVSLAYLLRKGLSKRQAIAALGLVSLGSGVTAAVMAASSAPAAAQASTGDGTYTVGEIIANAIVTGSLETSQLSGDIVGRSTPIDSLPGNIYVREEEDGAPSNPADNDLLFELGDWLE